MFSSFNIPSAARAKGINSIQKVMSEFMLFKMAETNTQTRKVDYTEPIMTVKNRSWNWAEKLSEATFKRGYSGHISYMTIKFIPLA